MARLTRRQKDETVETFLGINPNTFEVDRVYLSRGGTLTRYGKDMMPYSTYVGPGRDPRTEVVIVFGLTEIKSIRHGFSDSEYEKRITEELKAKAEAMKAAAQGGR